jgi:hypothetical protein
MRLAAYLLATSLTAEEFWLALWGEEGYSLKDWKEKYGGEDCIITPSRFNEALERINKLICGRLERVL